LDAELFMRIADKPKKNLSRDLESLRKELEPELAELADRAVQEADRLVVQSICSPTEKGASYFRIMQCDPNKDEYWVTLGPHTARVDGIRLHQEFGKTISGGAEARFKEASRLALTVVQKDDPDFGRIFVAALHQLALQDVEREQKLKLQPRTPEALTPNSQGAAIPNHTAGYYSNAIPPPGSHKIEATFHLKQPSASTEVEPAGAPLQSNNNNGSYVLAVTKIRKEGWLLAVQARDAIYSMDERGMYRYHVGSSVPIERSFANPVASFLQEKSLSVNNLKSLEYDPIDEWVIYIWPGIKLIFFTKEESWSSPVYTSDFPGVQVSTSVSIGKSNGMVSAPSCDRCNNPLEADRNLVCKTCEPDRD
jgi:hypothetical protein